MALQADINFWLPGSTRTPRKGQHLGSLLSKSTRMLLSWSKSFSELSMIIESWTMIECFKVKLSLCRGPIEEAEVVVEATEEDLMEAKIKLNQRWEEVTTEEASSEEGDEDSTTTSISSMCKMASVVAMLTSMLNSTLAQSILTWRNGKDYKGLTMLIEKVISPLSHPNLNL